MIYNEMHNNDEDIEISEISNHLLQRVEPYQHLK